MTTKINELLSLARSRLAGMPRRVRWAAAILGAAVVCGAVVLALTAGKGRTVRVGAPTLTPGQLTAAADTLAERGIPTEVVTGGLVVPAERLAEARRVIAELTARPEDVAAALAALAAEEDIWQTSAQSDKRWQAAKMFALGRLVETFPSVSAATVLYDPGRPRGLGGGQHPTAAVKVTMRPGTTLTHSLATAIADLVAGSVAGMDTADVRVVDGTGRSYRFDAATAGADAVLADRRAIETYYHEKIHTALSYVDGLVVGVSAVGYDGPSNRLNVTVAVPRSYLLPYGEGDERPVEEVLAEIRKSVLALVADRPCEVTANVYHDADAVMPAATRDAKPAASAGGWVLAVVAALATGGGAGVVVLARVLNPRKSADRGETRPSIAVDETPAAVNGEPSPPAGNPWDFLPSLTTAQTVSLVAAEHPQTIAIVLDHLPAAAAAAVLAALDEETQAAVGHRMTVLRQVDPVVVAEVGRTLGRRAAELAEAGPGAASTESRVAEILRHAGYATEKAVLTALSGQAPAVAEAVRRRMFRFEDLAELPVERLRTAMAAVDATELAVALRTAGQGVTEKLLAALSRSAARKVRQEMDRMGPVRLTEVEAAQQRVAEAVRRAESGEYVSESTRPERQVLA